MLTVAKASVSGSGGQDAMLDRKGDGGVVADGERDREGGSGEKRADAKNSRTGGKTMGTMSGVKGRQETRGENGRFGQGRAGQVRSGQMGEGTDNEITPEMQVAMWEDAIRGDGSESGQSESETGATRQRNHQDGQRGGDGTEREPTYQRYTQGMAREGRGKKKRRKKRSCCVQVRLG